MSDIIDIVLKITDKGTGTVKEVTKELRNLDNEAQGTTSRGLTGLQKMLSIGLVGAVGAATIALGGFGAAIADSVGKAASMEQGVADIRAQMGLSIGDTEKFKGLITDLGLDPQLKVTAEQAADAIGTLGTAGVSVDDIMGGVARSTILLANATGADFAEAASIASDVMAQFNIKAEDLDEAINQIVGTTVASKMNIHDYGLAIAQAGGVAGAQGIEFEDFNAVLASTAPYFASGSDAGTSFKSMLSNLLPKSKDAATLMRDLGLFTGLTRGEFEATQGKINKVKERIAELDPTSKNYAKNLAELNAEQESLNASLQEAGSAFYDANGNAMDFGAVAEQLRLKLGGLSDMELNDVLSTIWGPDGARTAIGLMKQGADGIAEISAQIAATDAAGSAAIRMDTFASSLEIAQGVIDTISMSIGDKFLPILRPLVERFTELGQTYGPQVIDFFGGVADKLGGFIEVLSRGVIVFEDGSGILMGFLEVLGMSGETAQLVGQHYWNFRDTLDAFLAPVTNLITEFFSWKDILLGTGAAITTILWPAIQMAIGAAGALLGPLTSLAGPILAWVAAIALLRNAWEEDWGGIKTSLTNAWGVITNIFGDVITKVMGVVELFQGAWNTLETLNADLGTRLAVIWSAIKMAASIIWEGIVETVTTLLPPFVAKLQQWGTAAWQWITDAVPVVLETLSGWLGSVVGWLGENLPVWIATLFQWGTALYTWIGEAIPKAIDSLTNFIRGVREQGESEGGSKFGGMVGEWATKLWRWIVDDLIPKVGPAFMSFIGAMGEYGANLATSLRGLAEELGRLLWTWIVDVTPVAVKKLSEWGAKLWGWITSNAPEWGRKIGEWASIAWEWIADITPKALQKIGDWGSTLWGWVKEYAPAWGDKIAEWAKIAWEWITKTAIPVALEKLGEWGVALWGWVTENAPKWAEKLGEWAVAAWTWITDTAIPGALEKLGEWGQSLLDWLAESWPIWRDNMIEAGVEIITGLRDGIEIAWIRLVDWFFGSTAFGGFVGDILEMFGAQMGPAYGVFYEDGKRIAYSLNDGSRYGLDDLRKTGSDMGSAISSGLRTSMDMHSPSRVMWGHGQDIMAGLTGGVREGFGGLRSEMDYVAAEIKASMDRTNADMLASIEYFTNQAELKALAASHKIANATKDATALLKQFGLDGKVVGYGPNGELVMEGINKLPNGGKGMNPNAGKTGTNYVPEVIDITTLGEALGADKVKAQAGATSISLLGGITLESIDLKEAAESTAKATEEGAKTVKDFIAGFTDFLGGTLEGASGVFRNFKLQEDKAYAEGNLLEFVNGEAGKAKRDLKGLYQGIQNSVADILGVSTSELSVTGADSLRLMDRLEEVLNGTTIDTNMEFIGKLLQDLVNFRSMSNYATSNPYFDSTLPTDERLTGGSTTTNYNITLQGSNNPNADVLGLVQMLGSLNGATSP